MEEEETMEREEEEGSKGNEEGSTEDRRRRNKRRGVGYVFMNHNTYCTERERERERERGDCMHPYMYVWHGPSKSKWNEKNVKPE